MNESDKLELAVQTLREIYTFGRRNSGYGYSCSTKALNALKELGEEDVTKR